MPINISTPALTCLRAWSRPPLELQHAFDHSTPARPVGGTQCSCRSRGQEGSSSEFCARKKAYRRNQAKRTGRTFRKTRWRRWRGQASTAGRYCRCEGNVALLCFALHADVRFLTFTFQAACVRLNDVSKKTLQVTSHLCRVDPCLNTATGSSHTRVRSLQTLCVFCC